MENEKNWNSLVGREVYGIPTGNNIHRGLKEQEQPIKKLKILKVGRVFVTIEVFI